jgi:hypothetical protein
MGLEYEVYTKAELASNKKAPNTNYENSALEEFNNDC